MKQISSYFALAIAAFLIVGAVEAQVDEFVEIRNGEVLAVAANTVLIRVEGEGVKRYTVPYDFRFMKDGEEITVRELREGDVLTSVRVRTVERQDVEETDVATIVAELVEAAKGVVAPEETAETAEVAEMAETTEAPAAAATAAAEDAAAQVEAAATSESGGMSTMAMVGLVIVALFLIMFAVSRLRKA
jgi:cobalamin biosynthesis Mg chelatase CobN